MKSRILIIGAGAQGNVVSGVLAKADDVGGITLGDIDVERPGELAEFVAPDITAAVRDDASKVPTDHPIQGTQLGPPGAILEAADPCTKGLAE